MNFQSAKQHLRFNSGQVVLLFVLLGYLVSSASAVPVPIKSANPVPLKTLRQNNRAVLPLAGTWRFQLTHGQITADGYHGVAYSPTTASSSQNGHPPQDALDPFRTGTNWCADNADFPQWWMVDLLKPQQLSSLAITWEFADATYQFKVEGSLDRKTWKLLADHTAAPGAKNGPVAITPTTIRWLRITVIGAQRANGNNAWAAIRNVQIMVVENGQAVAWAPKLPAVNTARDAFARTDYDDTPWSNIPVPANWEMEGFSRPTYDNPDDAVGLYRRWVDVPSRFAGQRVIWHFDGVNNGAEIFINGQPVGYHESGWTAFDLDVTKAIQPGKRNLLALRVSKRTPSVDLDTGDYWCLGGIYRENYLVAVPQTHIQAVTVVTDLDSAYKNAQLNAAVVVAGTPGATVALQGAVVGGDGSRVPGAMARGTATVGADGTALVRLQTPVTEPRLWSAEKPNLYFLMLNLDAGGKFAERVEQRFGFKKIDIRNGVLLWNGVPIKCTGSCRHEEWARYGHAMTEETWHTDLVLMKGCNINAIRTSHYNHAERFLELCDEMGMYILDEVPACWCDVKDPKLLPAFVQRTRETLDRDQNKPCVLAWSLSNESGYGPNVQAMLDYAKGNDPTRPAFISQCGPWNNPKIDFADYHYPDLNGVKRIATDKLRATHPAVMTEQPHIFYVKEAIDYDYGVQDFWGQTLANNWDVVWGADGIFGSFIWEWQDQGIADKFPDKHGVDPITGLRDNNNKGIVDSFRHVKPEYWHVKMVYSPVTIKAREAEAVNGRCLVPLQNRYSFTNLNELTCRWQALAQNKILAHGESHVNCAPRASTTATFPDTPDMDTLHLEFIHPDGRSIYVTKLRVRGEGGGAGASIRPPVKLQEQAQAVLINTADSQLILDKATGLIRSWRINGQNIIIGGPILNLGELRVTHGEHGAKNYIGSKQPPQLRTATVTTKLADGVAHLEVTADVYLVEAQASKGQFTYTLDVNPYDTVDVNWKMNWQAADANAWELGLKFLLPAQFDHLSWSREGLWTVYPQGHIGATEGTVTSQNVSFRSTKRDAYWASLTNLGGLGIEAHQADGPLHTRANVTPEGTLFFLSSAVAPPRDFSSNLVPDYEIHLKRDQPVSGSFRLTPVVMTK